ncbi:MAG: helix-turn-helix domain-containing protein [Pirellulales bacterium]|nr:helix-turn-helix domain-containing protein [Pirellulales bacterium]
MSPTLQQPAESPAKLLDVRTVAELLDCSTRHVYRLADAGRMPAPVKLGTLVRWPRQAVEDWISAGCPSCRAAAKGSR